MYAEKKLQHEQQKLEKGFLTPPQHWTSSRGAASAGKPLLFNKVRDDGVKAVLQELLNGTGIGSGGRDQQQPGAFSLRSLLCAAHQFFILELIRSRIERFKALHAVLATSPDAQPHMMAHGYEYAMAQVATRALSLRGRGESKTMTSTAHTKSPSAGYSRLRAKLR